MTACAGAVPQAEILPVDGDGVLDLAALERALTASAEPALVSVMLANNETGVLQPIADVVRLARAAGALVHCDAVQGAGKVPVDLHGLGVDYLSLSGHKLGGPTASARWWSATVHRCSPIVVAEGRNPIAVRVPKTSRASPASAPLPRRRLAVLM